MMFTRALSDKEAVRWHYLNWLAARGEVDRLRAEVIELKAALSRTAA